MNRMIRLLGFFRGIAAWMRIRHARTWSCPIDNSACGSDCMFWPDRCTESRRHNARSDADREEVLPPATCGRCGEVVTYQEFYRHKCKANKPNERAKQ